MDGREEVSGCGVVVPGGDVLYVQQGSRSPLHNYGRIPVIQ